MNSNKIAINLSSISKPYLSGIGRYTLELTKELIKYKQFIFYLYTPSLSDSIEHFSNIKNVIIKNCNLQNKVSRQLWHELYLPYAMQRDDINLYWSPAHRFPYFLSKSIPKVVTIHDLTWKYYPHTMTRFNYTLEKIFMPRAIMQANQIVVSSRATERDLIKHFPSAHLKTQVVYLGTTLQNTKKFLDINEPYILFVGTIEPRKNLYRLLKAYKLIKNKPKLIIVGAAGWGNIELNKLLSELQLQSNVKVLGYVDDELLHGLYSKALFLAQPSLYEGFGLPIIEANSYGVPVLTSNTASMPEVLGKGGVLVDPLSINSIKEGLDYLISKSSDYKQNAYSNAKRFTWKKTAADMVKVFSNVLNSSTY